jgi:hypothetical protein
MAQKEQGFSNDGAWKALKYTFLFFWWSIKIFWIAGKWIWKMIQKRKDEKAAAIVAEAREKQRVAEQQQKGINE